MIQLADDSIGPEFDSSAGAESTNGGLKLFAKISRDEFSTTVRVFWALCTEVDLSRKSENREDLVGFCKPSGEPKNVPGKNRP